MPNAPRYERLAREDLLTPPTLAALARRNALRTGEARFLSETEFATLEALCEILRPPYPRPTAREIALRIDACLADEVGDGWRYAELPPFRDAYRQGLALLREESVLGEGPLDAGLVRALWKGGTRAAWPFAARRFLEEALAEVATAAYSHPAGQDAIGYVGYADRQGWSRIGLDEKETWERESGR